MEKEELQSKTITWLRFPLAVVIVFIHNIDTSGIRETVSQIDYSHLSGIDIYNLMCFLLKDIVDIVVPLFFIFSGFLFFYKTKVWGLNIYFDKIKSKARTLALPYVLWNIIPIVLMAFFLFLKFDGSLSIYINQLMENGLLKIFWNYHDGRFPYNIPLWFLRDLIIVALLSPLVYYFVKYTKLYCIPILGIFYFTVSFPIPVDIRAIFFFTLGAYFSIHGKNMIVELRKGWLFWLISAIITLILSVYYGETNSFHYINFFHIIFGLITTINVASWLLERGRVSVNYFLSKANFFIFVAHNVYLLGRSRELVNFIFKSDSAFFLTIKFFLAPVICIFLCLGLYYVASKTVPKLLGILTGSRQRA